MLDTSGPLQKKSFHFFTSDLDFQLYEFKMNLK